MAKADIPVVDAESNRIIAMFEALPKLVAADADLVRRGRFLTTEFELGVGVVPLHVAVVAGHVQSVIKGPFLLKPWVFALRAEAATWAQLLEPVPAPGVHDVMALSKRGLLRIEGNLQPFMGNLQYIKDVVTAPRGLRTKR